MRTNIVLDDELLKKAFRLAKARTKRELVREALEEFIAVRRKKNLKDLRGKITFREDYDHKAMRKGAPSGTR